MKFEEKNQVPNENLKKKKKMIRSTSTSLLLATSVKCSWCSSVLSSRSSVMQNTLNLASSGSTLFAKTTNLETTTKKYICQHLLLFTYLAMKGTWIASRYSSVAIFVASPIFRQSISQNRAETVVVNETQSLTKVKGVDPVTSSHCARVLPPNLI